MANYFYFDAKGTKRGPCDEQQLQELIAGGSIKPDWQVESDDGYQGLARDFSGSSGSSISWRFDFGTHHVTCCVCCVIVWIAAILVGGATTYSVLAVFNEDTKILAFIPVIGIWGCCIFCIASTHMLCTWSLITSKAAQLYVENCEKK